MRVPLQLVCVQSKASGAGYTPLHISNTVCVCPVTWFVVVPALLDEQQTKRLYFRAEVCAIFSSASGLGLGSPSALIASCNIDAINCLESRARVLLPQERHQHFHLGRAVLRTDCGGTRA